MNLLPFDRQVAIVTALVEGVSIRATARLTGADRETVMRLGVRVGEGCARLHDRLVRDVHAGLVQCDEIWTFVQKKQGRLAETDSPELGDAYVFVGMDAVSKLTVGYRVGKRDNTTTLAFAHDLRARIIGAPQVSTDGFRPYVDALEAAFGSRVSHGVAIKLFEGEGEGVPEHRYAPGRVIGVDRIRVSGVLDEQAISTSYVERQNLTMRMHMRRFTRLANGFSKKLANLRAAVALHFAYVNFCRVHETTRVTPMMAAGLERRVWSVAELLAEATREAPAPESPSPVAPVRVVSSNSGPALPWPGFRVIKGGAS